MPIYSHIPTMPSSLCFRRRSRAGSDSRFPPFGSGCLSADLSVSVFSFFSFFRLPVFPFVLLPLPVSVWFRSAATFGFPVLPFPFVTPFPILFSFQPSLLSSFLCFLCYNFLLIFLFPGLKFTFPAYCCLAVTVNGPPPTRVGDFPFSVPVQLTALSRRHQTGQKTEGRRVAERQSRRA